MSMLYIDKVDFEMIFKIGYNKALDSENISIQGNSFKQRVKVNASMGAWKEWDRIHNPKEGD